MKAGSNLKKMQLASAIVAVTLLSAGCAMFEPRAEHYVPPPVGSTWVSARRDTGSYGSGSAQTPGKRVQQTWQGKEYIAFESPELTTLAHPDGSWLAQVRGATPVVTWDPPLSYEWPLEVGKTWTKKHRVTIHAAKRTLDFQSTQKVEAYEAVTVPAGTFKAFKISTTDTLGNENINWFAPDLGIFVKSSLKRTAKNAQGAGTRDTELVSQKITR